MPNRIIRSDLLDSERYWSCTIEARELFIHLLLLADDFGCVSAAPVYLGRHAFWDRPGPAKLSKLLAELVDQDLIRTYDSYAFIPRFNQRLRRSYLRYPAPPESLYQDDEHAKKLFNKTKDKPEKPSDKGPSDVGHTSDTRRPEVEVEVEVEVEDKNKNTMSSKLDAARRVLKFLNDKTGRRFPPVESNLKLIVARLNEGHSEDDMRMVIARQWREWKGNERMMKYARPKTLFNATNFNNYIGECVTPQGENDGEVS